MALAVVFDAALLLLALAALLIRAASWLSEGGRPAPSGRSGLGAATGGDCCCWSSVDGAVVVLMAVRGQDAEASGDIIIAFRFFLSR
jgi:hypothetical protein